VSFPELSNHRVRRRVSPVAPDITILMERAGVETVLRFDRVSESVIVEDRSESLTPRDPFGSG
jgi:hypothetical protein